MVDFSPITLRRWAQFKANKRGFWSLWIFLGLFFCALFANFLANDKPLLVSYQGQFYVPVVASYPETSFGGDFETEADYRDPYIIEKISQAGWIVWPPVRYYFDTINYDLPAPAPSSPTHDNWLGTDDQGRDVVARVLYGFRLSVLFGLALTLVSSLVGVAAGALQGYYGGWVDLIAQRVIEIWSSMPSLVYPHYLFRFLCPGVLDAAFDSPALFVDSLGGCCAGRVFAGAEPRLCSGGSRPWRFELDHHAPPYPAQCGCGNADHAALSS
jgi:microcin C transport system permease protein